MSRWNLRMTTEQLGPKQQEIMSFLHRRIFDPILESPEALKKIKEELDGQD